MLRGFLVASLFVVGLSSFHPGSVFAHGGTEISVEGEARANSLVQLEGEEFGPNDNVRIELRKEGVEPLLLGRVSADGDGAFAVELHVPASVAPGIYQLAAEGEESATTAITILGGTAGDAADSTVHAFGQVSPDRSTGESAGLALFTALLAATGLAAILFSRTRPHFGA